MSKFSFPEDLRASSKPRGVTSPSVVDGSPKVEGERNHSLFQEACSLVSKGYDYEKVFNFCHALNLTYDPPLVEDEVTKIVESANKHHIVAATEIFSPPRPVVPEEIFIGLSGEIINTIAPNTEASKIIMLMNLLSAVGSIIGRNSYYDLGGKKHYPNLFVVAVGRTMSGRKTTAMDVIENDILDRISEQYLYDDTVNIWKRKGGLSSAEGLASHVCDTDEEDGSSNDKRLFIFESEFATILKRMNQQGNTLSAILRQGFDGENISTLTKKNPIQATGVHLSVLVNITPEELNNLISPIELANGFLNRFIILHSERSRKLPDPKALDTKLADTFAASIESVIDFGKQQQEISFDEDAKGMYDQLYMEQLSEDQFGTVGALMSRGAVHIIRLALLFAIFDKSKFIRPKHLNSAIHIWNYSVTSIKYHFESFSPDADKVHQIIVGLRGARVGLTEISTAQGISNNWQSKRINSAIDELKALGIIREEPLEKDTDGKAPRRFTLLHTLN